MSENVTQMHHSVMDPTRELISSERVLGTPVFGSDREQLGEVHSMLINKKTGTIPYALIEFGGFFGVNEQYFPVPWAALDYDIDLEGYMTHLTEEELRKAPRMKLDSDGHPCDWHAEEIEGYYSTLPWWGL